MEVKKGALWLELVADPDARIPEDIDWRTLLAVQSLRRGYVRCEISDKSGKFIYSVNLRIRQLLLPGKEKVKALIPLPRGERPAHVKLTL